MANEGYSILDVINDEYGVILTRNGCVSVAFRMYNPECYRHAAVYGKDDTLFVNDEIH